LICVCSTQAACIDCTFSSPWALHACKTAAALNHNWYPSPASSVRTYQSWNSMSGFWQDGTVLESLANWMHRANNTRQLSIIRSSLRSLEDLVAAYQPIPSFDDMAWYGMAYARIFEVLGHQLGEHQAAKFGDAAANIFKWVAQKGWDDNSNTTTWCGGGFWWDSNKAFKATITNVQMIYLGAKLHNILPTKDPLFLTVANRTWHWMQNHDLVDPSTGILSNSLDGSCKAETGTGWTYQQGVLVGGLAELAKASPEGSEPLVAQSLRLVNAVRKHMTHDDVLLESCDNQTGSKACNADARMYKGLFVRNVRYLMDYLGERAGHAAIIQNYTDWLIVNAKRLLSNGSCTPEPQKDQGWVSHKDKESNPVLYYSGKGHGCSSMYGQCYWPSVQVAKERCSTWSDCRSLYCSSKHNNGTYVCYARGGTALSDSPGDSAYVISGGGETCNISWIFGKSLNNRSIGPLFASNWGGVYNQGAPAQQSAALDLFGALVPTGTMCTNNTACTWDPKTPAAPADDYDCTAETCPSGGYTCCFSNNQGVPECCDPNQFCNNTAMECQASSSSLLFP